MEETKFNSVDNNDFTMPMCNKCKHHIEGDQCKAFKSIPLEVLTNTIYHFDKIKDQIGDFVFELDESDQES